MSAGEEGSAPTLIELQLVLLSLPVAEMQFSCWDALTFSQTHTATPVQTAAEGRRVLIKPLLSFSLCPPEA